MRRFGKRIHVDIDPSLAGMASALVLLRRKTEKIKVSKLALEGPIVSVSVQRAFRMDEDKQGWSIVAKSDGGNWWGEVAHVDEDSNTLYVRPQTAGIPDKGQEFSLVERDYLEQIKEWVAVQLAAGEGRSTKIDEWIKSRLDALPQEGAASTDCAPEEPQGGLRKSQAKAVKNADRPLSIIWGPPGTGKTFTVGHVVSKLAKDSSKVLVIAPTNVAADHAALAVDNARVLTGTPLRRGELIRPGYVTLRLLEQRAHLMKWTETLNRFSEQLEKLSELKRECLERKRKSANEAEKEKANLELTQLSLTKTEVEQQRKSELWMLGKNAKIVVTTIHSAFANRAIFESLSEEPGGRLAIVVDEASMVSRFILIPFLAMAPNRLVISGDPKQLSPIGGSDNPGDLNVKYWVSDSLFDLVGASGDNLITLERKGVITLLEQQNRMTEQLCRPISEKYYQGRLVTTAPPAPPPVFPGGPESPTVIVDPMAEELPDYAPQHIVYSKIKNNSFERSAWISIKVAKLALESDPKVTVLIITPFAEQKRKLRSLAAGYLSEFESRVRVGSVHVAQGLEADLVIFDLVVPNHRWLTGQIFGDSSERLFCVAFSRAKRQIILVGHPVLVWQNKQLRELVKDAVQWNIKERTRDSKDSMNDFLTAFRSDRDCQPRATES